MKNDGITYKEAFEKEEYTDALINESLDTLGYVIEPKYLFSSIVDMCNDGSFSIDFLQEAVNSIVNSTKGRISESVFDGIFEDMDLTTNKLGKVVSERTKAMSRIIKTIDTIETTVDVNNVDILGSAYIELISKFASTAGKKAGEFYTMTTPAKLVARLATLGLTDAVSICDPACGSGSLLLQASKLANIRYFYGQELTASTYNIAKMNMMLHNIAYKNFKIINCNTITNDEEFKDMKYTIQVANPPYSVHWEPDSKLLDDDRFSPYGVLAPKSYEDLMFLEHMIYHMDDNGRIVVLLPHGVLFRGGAEGKIRQFIVENQNYLDAVIGLPKKLFTSTDIPVACLVLKKNRGKNTDNICFIDASNEFACENTQNYLTDDNIDKIVKAYEAREDIDKYCHVAHMKEIVENDYNLNISRYVDTFEEEEVIDIVKIKANLVDIQAKKQEAIDKVNETMKLLGL